MSAIGTLAKVFWLLRNVPRWWLPSVISAFAGFAGIGVLVFIEFTGPRPPRGQHVQEQLLGASDHTVHLAGTGSWLPLARVLSLAFQEVSAGPEIVVHGSIGSGGGRRAVSNGLIDIGLVSGMEGQLRAPEGLRISPIATAAVVFAVNTSVGDDEVSSEQIVSIYLGETTNWDDGQRVVPFLRERGDSATRVVSAGIPGLSEAFEQARAQRHFPTLITDSEMGQALHSTPGALGLYDLGSISIEQLEVKPLSIDGVVPSLQTISDGRYPFRRTLAVVVPEGDNLNPRASEFLDFLFSSEGEEVIRQNGYMPLQRAEP